MFDVAINSAQVLYDSFADAQAAYWGPDPAATIGKKLGSKALFGLFGHRQFQIGPFGIWNVSTGVAFSVRLEDLVLYMLCRKKKKWKECLVVPTPTSLC